jgi:hypothetical protein
MPFLDALAAHRMKREQRIMAALRTHGPVSLEALVGPVYGRSIPGSPGQRRAACSPSC